MAIRHHRLAGWLPFVCFLDFAVWARLSCPAAAAAAAALPDTHCCRTQPIEAPNEDQPLGATQIPHLDVDPPSICTGADTQ